MIGRGAVVGCAAFLLLSAPAHALMAVVGDGHVDRGTALITLKRTESYHDFQKALEIAPDFKPAREQLKNFVVTRRPAASQAAPQ